MSSAVGLPVAFTEQGPCLGLGLPEQVGNEAMNGIYPVPALLELTISFLLDESCLDFLEQGKWMGEVRGTEPPEAREGSALPSSRWQ